MDSKHVYSTSYSTRIAEIKDSSDPNGPEYPAGSDHGYLWKLYIYWRFAEKDGGVYLQCEAISLTRDIPFGLGWLIRPLTTSIPKQSLDRVLAQTRAAVHQTGPVKHAYFFLLNLATHILHAVADRLLVNVQSDGIHIEEPPWLF